MEITGKIIAILDPRGGTSARTGAEWKSQEYVLETQEQYPRKMVFDVFGADKIAQFNIQMGELLTVSFDIDAREWNGRWFNSIRAWRVDRNVAVGGDQPGVAPAMGAAPAQPVNAAPFPPTAQSFAAAPNEKDDLPF